MSPLVPDRLATGRIVDLADPPQEFDWLDEIARPLGRIARFAGQAADREGAPYSVGEHSVRGARAIVEETHDDSAGLAFLIHDAHEVLGGDVKRPFMDLAELIAARDGIAPRRRGPARDRGRQVPSRSRHPCRGRPPLAAAARRGAHCPRHG